MKPITYEEFIKLAPRVIKAIVEERERICNEQITMLKQMLQKEKALPEQDSFKNATFYIS